MASKKKAKKRPGRKPLDEEKRRTSLVHLRFRQDEADRITAIAEAEGLSIAVWCRQQVLRALAKAEE